jgi:NAD(P)-dependent dehydrogenase (short-subunit alcohol dehydrogenase family)
LIAITAGQAVNATPMQADACAAKGDQPTGPGPGDGVGARRAGQRHLARSDLGDRGDGRLAPDESTREAHYARIPLKRWGEVEEIAEAAVFLSSASAAYVSGAILDVDGGSQLGDASRTSVQKGLA